MQMYQMIANVTETLHKQLSMLSVDPVEERCCRGKPSGLVPFLQPPPDRSQPYSQIKLVEEKKHPKREKQNCRIFQRNYNIVVPLTFLLDTVSRL